MASPAEDDFDLPHATFLARAMAELQLKTGLHDRLFQIGRAAWQLSQDSGEISFTSPNGVIARARVQIIGTFNTLDGTWLWAWDHPSVVESLAEHARLTRAYGERQGIAELTTSKLSVSEAKCWEFTAIACKLGGFEGAYRGPAGTTMVFITFGEVQLSKA